MRWRRRELILHRVVDQCNAHGNCSSAPATHKKMSDHRQEDRSNDNIKSSNKPMIPSSNTSIQNANWSGTIPILLSLAPTSLSSPAAPRPIHKLISRATYLHVALHEEIMQLAEYAPVAGMTGLVISSSAMNGLSVEEPPDDDDDGPADAGGEADGGGEKKRQSADNANANDAKKEVTESATRPREKESNNKQQQQKQIIAYPECWFEDEASGMPLRWHLFVGILYDLVKGKSMLDCSSWRGGGDTSSNNAISQHNFLPWRIRVHFTSYPNELLPLDDGAPQPPKSDTTNNSHYQRSRITALVRRTFSNSLKQALFLQYGSSKVAMSVTKSSHEKLWDAVLRSNYGSYHEVNVDLQSGVTEGAVSSAMSSTDTMIVKEEKGEIPQLIPIRIMYNGMPAIQRPTKHAKEREGMDCKKRPMEVLEQLGTYQAPPYTTLADVLADVLPDHFAVDPSTGCTSVLSSSDSSSSVYYCIQGVRPSTKCAMVDLWRALSHPDHFLYIVVVTKQ